MPATHGSLPICSCSQPSVNLREPMVLELSHRDPGVELLGLRPGTSAHHPRRSISFPRNCLHISPLCGQRSLRSPRWMPSDVQHASPRLTLTGGGRPCAASLAASNPGRKTQQLMAGGESGVVQSSVGVGQDTAVGPLGRTAMSVLIARFASNGPGTWLVVQGRRDGRSSVLPTAVEAVGSLLRGEQHGGLVGVVHCASVRPR